MIVIIPKSRIFFTFFPLVLWGFSSNSGSIQYIRVSYFLIFLYEILSMSHLSTTFSSWTGNLQIWYAKGLFYGFRSIFYGLWALEFTYRFKHRMRITQFCLRKLSNNLFLFFNEMFVIVENVGFFWFLEIEPGSWGAGRVPFKVGFWNIFRHSLRSDWGHLRLFGHNSSGTLGSGHCLNAIFLGGVSCWFSSRSLLWWNFHLIDGFDGFIQCVFSHFVFVFLKEFVLFGFEFHQGCVI